MRVVEDELSGFLRHIELRRDDVPDWKTYPFSIPAVRNLGRLVATPRLYCVTRAFLQNPEKMLADIFSVVDGVDPES